MIERPKRTDVAWVTLRIGVTYIYTSGLWHGS
jgi:hypothetical protein